MDDNEIKEQFALVQARMVGLRDVVARLLAYEIADWDNPKAVLENFSNATDERNYEFSKTNFGASAFGLQLQEAARKEVDWVVAAAQKMAEG